MGLPGVPGLHRPAAVFSLFLDQHVQGGLHACVVGHTGGLEVVQGAQDVVAPARWEGQHQHLWVDDLPAAVRAEELMLEEEFAALGGDVCQLSLVVGVTAGKVFMDALQDGEGRVQGAVNRRPVFPLAVESAVGHLLGDQVVDDRAQGFGVGAEVAGVVEEHAADAHIAGRPRRPVGVDAPQGV